MYPFLQMYFMDSMSQVFVGAFSPSAFLPIQPKNARRTNRFVRWRSRSEKVAEKLVDKIIPSLFDFTYLLATSQRFDNNNEDTLLSRGGGVCGKNYKSSCE
jgi:hypothetical protein